MALHQPVMSQHHLPRWAEVVGLAIIAVALAAGGALIIANTDLFQSTQPVAPQRLIIQSASGGLEYTGIPWRAGRAPGIPVQTANGGILYVGIPYPPPAESN